LTVGVQHNELGQPVGEPVPGWTPRQPVRPVTLTGRTVALEPLSTAHADDLFHCLVEESPPRLWTYLFSGPFADRASFDAYLQAVVDDPTMAAMAVVVDGVAAGHECLLRCDPRHGSVEVGNIALGARLQRTTAATEAAYLLMRHVFDDLGYRRYEWKCDSLNEPSRRAARRFGFRYEGRFRKAVVYKGRNRDTDWFAVTDDDWASLREAYETWLEPGNFDERGRQRAPLRARAEGVGSTP
jgi:RimJ/RimL family protein N-acetyltransferase